MQIGEVARKVGVATSAIRFYEETGLIPEPERTPSGYRVYDSAVIDRLAFIRAGQAVGLTLGELAEVLQIRDRGEAPCRHVTDLIGIHIREIDDRIRDLRKLRQDLAGLAETAAAFNPAECSPESVCRILNSPN
ncbi:MAG TPA: heavy metal-responsive transcriptional regulator [Acidimicrobiia bacterium]|nr:heavy metal-responsive transcriptional regulator [Acidimicrobiia bacterium]